MEISTYLQGRRHNSQLLSKIAEEAIQPTIDRFNEDQDRQLKAEWDMSAKYQSIQITFEMEDGDNMSDEAIQEIVYGNLSEVISEWFAAEACEEDYNNSTYFSVDIGL